MSKKKKRCVLVNTTEPIDEVESMLFGIDTSNGVTDYVSKFFGEKKKETNSDSIDKMAKKAEEKVNEEKVRSEALKTLGEVKYPDIRSKAPVKEVVETTTTTKTRVETVQKTPPKFRTSVALNNEKDMILVIDRVGTIEAIPLITDDIGIGTSNLDLLMERLTRFLTVATTPTAIFKNEDFINMVEERNITGHDIQTSFFTIVEEYILGYRVFSQIKDELYDVCDAVGERTFVNSIPVIVTRMRDSYFLNDENYVGTVMEFLYSRKRENEGRVKFIDFIENQYEKGDIVEFNIENPIVQMEMYISDISDILENLDMEDNHGSDERDERIESDATDEQPRILGVDFAVDSESDDDGGTGDEPDELLSDEIDRILSGISDGGGNSESVGEFRERVSGGEDFGSFDRSRSINFEQEEAKTQEIEKVQETQKVEESRLQRSRVSHEEVKESVRSEVRRETKEEKEKEEEEFPMVITRSRGR